MGVGRAQQTAPAFLKVCALQWVICSFIVCRITAVTALTFSNEQLLGARIYSRRRRAGMNKVSCSSSGEGEKVLRTEDCCLIVGYLQILSCRQLRAERVAMQVMFNLQQLCRGRVLMESRERCEFPSKKSSPCHCKRPSQMG